MPESNSIYDIYAGAGKASGAYEASLRGVQDVWTDIEFSRKRTEQRAEKREATLDTLLSMVELGGTLVGSSAAKKKFREQELPSMQKIAAEKGFKRVGKKALGELDITGVKEGKSMFEQYVGTKKGKEWYGGFAPEEVGMTGKSWKDLSFWEKLGQEKMYKFGEGEAAYTIGKTDISAITGYSKYGGDPDLGKYQSSLFDMPELETADVSGLGEGDRKLELPETTEYIPPDIPGVSQSQPPEGEKLQLEGKESVTLSRRGLPGQTTQVDPDTAKRMLEESNIWDLEKQGGLGAILGSKEYEGAFGESQDLFEEAGYKRPRGAGGGRRF